jgi:ABC-type multidrug transport system permease subunit
MINFSSLGGIVADIVVICIFVISIFGAYKRGLTALMVHLVGLIVTIIAVLVLCKPVTNWIYNNTGIDEFFAEHIESSIGDFLEEQISDYGEINPEKTNISESIVNKINGYIEEAKESSVSNISKFVAEKLSYIVISAIVVILLCIVVRIATFLLRGVLYFISHLPIIRTVDKLGGAAYGLFRAYVIIYALLAVLSLLSPLLADTGLISLINSSKYCSIFYNNNVFLKILG